MLPWGEGEWALVVQPGSDSADLFRAMADLPSGLEFTTAYGDVDLVMVYRMRRPEVLSRRDLLTLQGSVLPMPDAVPDRARWMTSGEQEAYKAGYAEALTTVRLFLSRLAGVDPEPGDASAAS